MWYDLECKHADGDLRGHAAVGKFRKSDGLRLGCESVKKSGDEKDVTQVWGFLPPFRTPWVLRLPVKLDWSARTSGRAQ